MFMAVMDWMSRLFFSCPHNRRLSAWVTGLPDLPTNWTRFKTRFARSFQDDIAMLSFASLLKTVLAWSMLTAWMDRPFLSAPTAAAIYGDEVLHPLADLTHVSHGKP